MANILNLALKKDVFEGLINKTDNEIPIDKTDWWKKRLMDLDTGVFKDFDTVRASCGSADKIDFPIIKIEDRGSRFIVRVDLGIKKEELEKSVPVAAEENKNEPEPVYDEPEQEEPEYVGEQEDDAEETYVSEQEFDMKKEIQKLFNDFCMKDNVFVVNTPQIIIRKNGLVVGSGKYIPAVKDASNVIPLGCEEVVKYRNMSDKDFVAAISYTMNRFLEGNYVFIRKGDCGFTKWKDGCDAFVFRVTVRKIYLFRRMMR